MSVDNQTTMTVEPRRRSGRTRHQVKSVYDEAKEAILEESPSPSKPMSRKELNDR